MTRWRDSDRPKKDGEVALIYKRVGNYYGNWQLLRIDYEPMPGMSTLQHNIPRYSNYDRIFEIDRNEHVFQPGSLPNFLFNQLMVSGGLDKPWRA